MAYKNSLLRVLCTLACLALATISGLARAEIQTTVTYYHSDFSGSPVAATSGTGVPLWTTDYLPYGERYDTDEGANNDVWFAGHVEDDPAGLVYMEARYYDPDIGRFHGVDAMGFVESSPHSFNRYSYANNNPYKYVDPDGNNPKLVVDFVLNVALNYATTGNADFAGAAVETATGAFNPLKTLKTAAKLADAVKVKKLAKNAPHGNTADDRPATLYEKYDKDGNFLKHGVTKHENPTKRYTKKQIDGGTVVATDRGPRRDILKKERDLVERQPGPENRERWAGRRRGE